MSDEVYGSQTTLAYSRMGRTCAKYICCFIDVGHLHKLCHINQGGFVCFEGYVLCSVLGGGGGGTRMARGGIRLVHGHTKSTLITYFSGMKIDPKFACIFLNLSVMSFPKFVYMTKNTPFFPVFAHFCTPKRCTRIQCLVLKNNPNYVNFWMSLTPSLIFKCPPPPPRVFSPFEIVWYM